MAIHEKGLNISRYWVRQVVGFYVVSAVLASGPTWAAAPSAEQALKLAPVQSGVDYDHVNKCIAIAAQTPKTYLNPAKVGLWK